MEHDYYNSKLQRTLNSTSGAIDKMSFMAELEDEKTRPALLDGIYCLFANLLQPRTKKAILGQV